MKKANLLSLIEKIGLILLLILFINFKNYYVLSPYDPNTALEKARASLRKKQKANLSLKIQSLYDDQPVTDSTLSCLKYFTRYDSTENPNKVRRNIFYYDRKLEDERISRAKAIIRRVEPGPFEDPNYFALLAYQAASIELILNKITSQGFDTAVISKFLLGTVASPDIDAYAKKESIDDYTIIVIYSGLIDLVYQASKVVVEAIEPKRSTNNQSVVTANINLDSIKSNLESDPKAINRLYNTLEAYFFYGYPRASAYESLPLEHYPVLSILVGQAERWMIGHEYGHGLKPSLEKVPDGVDDNQVREFIADNTSTFLTVLSAYQFDGIPPEYSLGGAIFALECLDILQRASNILKTGDEIDLNNEESMSIKPEERARNVINYFKQSFDVEYDHSKRSCKLIPLPQIRNEVPLYHNFTYERIKGAYAYANILKVVWEPVKLRLLEDYKQKRILYKSWIE